MYGWTNPKNINTDNPFLYLIEIEVENKKFTYIGKGSRKSRLKEYPTNVKKILEGKSRRLEVKA